MLTLSKYERRRSKQGKQIKVQKQSSSWLGWLWCFSLSNNKVSIKDKYESVIYMANEDEKDNLEFERKQEFNKSKNSEKVVGSSNSGNRDSISKRKSSIIGNNLDLSDKLWKVEPLINSIIITSQNKERIIKDYNRRHSWSIAISKLESNRSIVLIDYNYKNELGQDQVQGNQAVSKKKRHHKGSCDSSNLSNGSGNGGQISNKLLQMKSKAVKEQNNSNISVKKSLSNMNQSVSNRIGNESSQRNTIKSRILVSHKDSKDSSAMLGPIMDESVAPPMIIDNSAMIFSNTKKNSKYPIRNFNDKSEVNYQSDNGKAKKRNLRSSWTEGEGERDGEGESYSSSCSCSSCLRDRNADNGLSLKLSQYSYRPTQGGFLKHETEDESQMVNMSGYKEIVDDESTYDKADKNTRIAERDNSGEGFPQMNSKEDEYDNKLDVSQPDFPDNLNNGKFKMESIKVIPKISNIE